MKRSFLKYLSATALFICAYAHITVTLALSNTAEVPVLLYHSGALTEPCDYAHNASAAFAEDLELFHKEGYTVVPLHMLVQWARGYREGFTLPQKVVGIAVDDGYDGDWVDNLMPEHACAPMVSIKTRLRNFKATHPELPSYSPHATFFVIASPTVRSLILKGQLSDYWWQDVNVSGIGTIGNHSADHEARSVAFPFEDPDLHTLLPASGFADNIWSGQNNFFRINELVSATAEVVNAGKFIMSKTGVWPELFAYPFTHASEYLRGSFFPKNIGGNHTLGAFCGNLGTRKKTYITRQSDPYCLGRFTHQLDWNSPEELLSILKGSQQ